MQELHETRHCGPAKVIRSVWIYSVMGCALLLRGGLLETGSSPPPLPRSSASVSRKVKRRPFFNRMIVDWPGCDCAGCDCPMRDASVVPTPGGTTDPSPAVPRAKRLEV